MSWGSSCTTAWLPHTRPHDSPPAIPHTALFIYSECFTESEEGRRFHVFARLEDSPQAVLFFTRDHPDQLVTVWHQHELPEPLSIQIEDTFNALKIPLNPGVRACDSLLYHRGLELQVQGASLCLGWDAADCDLADALSPLTSLLQPIVNEMKAELEANGPKPFFDNAL